MTLAAKAVGVEGVSAITYDIALFARGITRLEQGDAAGVDDLRRVAEDESPDRATRSVVIALDNFAEGLWLVQGARKAIGTYDAAQQLAEERGLRDLAALLAAESLRARYDLGLWDALIKTVEESHAWFRSEGGGGFREVFQQPYLAAVLAWRGEAARAQVVMTACLPRARELDDTQVRVPAVAVAAQVALAVGDTKGAIGLLDELDIVTAESPAIFRWMHAADAARICVAAGDCGRAQAFASGPTPALFRPMLSHLTAQAVAAEAREDFAAALAIYAEAASGWDRSGHAMEHGLAQLGAGRCALTLDRPATDALIRARELLSSLGARPALAETDDLLRTAMARTS